MPSNFITLKKAIEITSGYRKNKKELLSERFKASNALATCETYSREAFDAVLKQPGCVSIRVYYSMDTNFNVNTVIVGVDAAGKDILPDTENDDSGIIGNSIRCPHECPPDSPLNR